MENSESEKPTLDKNQIINYSIIAIFFTGIFILAVGAGLMLFKNNPSKASDIQIIDPSNSPSAGAEIVVDVEGEVAKPGVYHLKSDARASEAVAAAGGLTADADRASVNLAAKLIDGQKINVPKIGEVGQTSGGHFGSSSLVNINTADSAELDNLPGIGPVTASKIISARPFASLEELVSKKAVTQSVFDKIKDLISL